METLGTIAQLGGFIILPICAISLMSDRLKVKKVLTTIAGILLIVQLVCGVIWASNL